MKVWFDPQGDLLEVQVGKPRKGYFKDAGNDVFLRLDTKGNVIGFAILNVTKRQKQTKEVELPIKGSFSQ